jgi:hypothetical protein
VIEILFLAEFQSSKGGTWVLPTTNLTAPGAEFGTVAAGAPYFGQDEMDKNICNFFFFSKITTF